MKFSAEKTNYNPNELNNTKLPDNEEERNENCGLPDVVSYGNKIVYSNYDDIIGEVSNPYLLLSLKKCLAIKEAYKSVLPQFKRCSPRAIVNFQNQRKYLSRYYPNLLYFLETEFANQGEEVLYKRVSPETILNRVEIKLNDLTYLSEIVINKIKSIKEQLVLNDLSRSNRGDAEEIGFGAGSPHPAPRKNVRVKIVAKGKVKSKGFVKALSGFRAGLFIKIIDYIEKYECNESHACRQVCKMKKYSNEDPNRTRKLFNAHKNHHGGSLEGLREFLNSLGK